MNGFAICASPRVVRRRPIPRGTAETKRITVNFVLRQSLTATRLEKMGVSSAPECDWDESPQKRLRETLAFADNLMTKNMLRQLLNVEE